MEFRPSLSSNPPPPKNLYPCLATITLGGSGDKQSRRMSWNSSDDEGGLKRVISGNRRKTSFGQVADRGDIRRSVDGGSGGAGAGAGAVGGAVEKGTWYWRVQAGVNDTHLVLMPLSQPPNALLTSAPAPLSQVMPSHSTEHQHTASPTGNGDGEHESFGTKVKNLFTGNRKNSKSDDHTTAAPTTNTTGPSASTTDPVQGQGQGDKIIDQTGGGEQLPSAAANAIGADNLNANAETGWPGVVNGEKLGAVVVSLASIDHAHVKLHQHRKEGSFVTVPITAQLAGVGQTSETAPKSGFIKFEFDKDWIGAKGEAELLHHYITTSAQNPPQPTSQFANQNFQLGGGQGGNAAQAPPIVNEVAPDHTVSTASSGKVAGT